MNSEVLIIGGGIIGLSLARELYRNGVRRVTILEREAEIGREASNAAAGMLAPNAENDEASVFTEFCLESLRLYENFAAELLDETGVDIELDKNGTLYLAFNDEDVSEIRRRFDWQRSAGLNVEHLAAAEVRRIEPFVSPDVREALFFPDDWQVENRRLIAALKEFAVNHEIDIRVNTEIKSLIIENGKVIGARTANQFFFAEKVVLTTGAWTSLIEAKSLRLPKIKPIRGQIISFKTAKRLFQKVIYSPRGYLVPRTDGQILIGATVEDAGFDKSVTAAGIDFLREVSTEISPSTGNLEIYENRVGLRPFAADGLPVIGSFPQVENFFIAAAHFRNGILLAPLTAKIMAEKIAENIDSEYFDFFSPRRFQTAKTF